MSAISPAADDDPTGPVEPTASSLEEERLLAADRAEARRIIHELIDHHGRLGVVRVHVTGREGHDRGRSRRCNKCQTLAWLAADVLVSRGIHAQAQGKVDPSLSPIRAGLEFLTVPGPGINLRKRFSTLMWDANRRHQSLDGNQQRFDRLPVSVLRVLEAAALEGRLSQPAWLAIELYRELFTVAHNDGELLDDGELFYGKMAERIWLRERLRRLELGEPEPAEVLASDLAVLAVELESAVATDKAAERYYADHIGQRLHESRSRSIVATSEDDGDVIDLLDGYDGDACGVSPTPSAEAVAAAVGAVARDLSERRDLIGGELDLEAHAEAALAARLSIVLVEPAQLLSTKDGWSELVAEVVEAARRA